MPLNWLLFLTMAVAAMDQTSHVPSPAEENACSGMKDERSFLSTFLTGLRDTCIAAALDVCGPAQGDSRYASLIEEAREVVQQLSAVASKLDSHLSAAVSASDSDLSAAVNESDSQPCAAMNESEPRVSVALSNWESNISYAGNISESLPRHCQDLLKSGDSGSGLRQVYPYPDRPVQGVTVYCDHITDGGGWTVFQRRTSDAVRQDFYRNWTEYEFGFGELEGEFWMGLTLLHQLTSATLQQLRIDLDDYEGEHRYAKYGYFSVTGPNDNYRLGIGSYSGDAKDSLKVHQGKQFSTHDADNDSHGENCAELYKGAWWYDACHQSNLNGYQHVGSGIPYAEGIVWHSWKGYHYSLKRVTMMVRPAV